MDSPLLGTFKLGMARCLSCNGLLTRRDVVCYVCGDPAPKLSKLPGERKPTSALSNILFVASLGLTGYSFVSGHSMSLVFSLTASGVILIARLFDWMRKQNLDTKRDKLASRSAWI